MKSSLGEAQALLAASRSSITSQQQFATGAVGKRLSEAKTR